MSGAACICNILYSINDICLIQVGVNIITLLPVFSDEL